jgi:hypothetical protein
VAEDVVGTTEGVTLLDGTSLGVGVAELEDSRREVELAASAVALADETGSELMDELVTELWSGVELADSGVELLNDEEVELAKELSVESDGSMLELGVGEGSTLDDGGAASDGVEEAETDSIGGKHVLSYTCAPGKSWNDSTCDAGMLNTKHVDALNKMKSWHLGSVVHRVVQSDRLDTT